MKRDTTRDSRGIDQVIGAPGLTLKAIELLSKLEADVASILATPQSPQLRHLSSRLVRARVRRGSIRES